MNGNIVRIFGFRLVIMHCSQILNSEIHLTQ